MREAVKSTLVWLGVIWFCVGFWVGAIVLGVLLW